MSFWTNVRRNISWDDFWAGACVATLPWLLGLLYYLVRTK